jgi:pimeloyl-ACP methyl ester carboxylesterase
MNAFEPTLPLRARLTAGEPGIPGTLPDPYPFETIAPVREGFVEREGVRTWYAQFGTEGPWLALAPVFQIANSYLLKGVLPWLARHFRVVVCDLRGNGRSDRPTKQSDYTFDHYYADFLTVLDAAGVERAAVIGVSASTMLAIRLAGEQPERVSHLVLAGGYVERLMTDPVRAAAVRGSIERMRENWGAYLDEFFGIVFTEPHSTKQYEDGFLHCGWATDGETVAMGLTGWLGADLRDLARRIACPTLVIHGAEDARVPPANSETIASLIPGASLHVIEGGGHLLQARDPVAFARLVRDFCGERPRRTTWARGMARKRRALFVSSAIGLGHVQRDLAIARQMRALQPDLEIEWFTVDPAARYLVQEGEKLHPLTTQLANESRHFESRAGEHDLQAFFALRTMDEHMARNFLVFVEALEDGHYDIVVGDEAWDVDYHYHENPELKRQPFVFLTDFVGCLPMEEGNDREAFLCADRNADDIEHVARYPWIRDRALFVGNPEDAPDVPFGPGLPQIRDWTARNFRFTGYALPFDPARLAADREMLRARHGYRPDEKVVIAAVGGTGVGTTLLRRIAEALPAMRRADPAIRMVMVAGPRIDRAMLPECAGLEVRPYVHNLFEHLACSDLALVQGGLSTCMELVAMQRPFLSFPLERHFEQCIHVRHRLRNYCADCAVSLRGLSPEGFASRALETMHARVAYKPVETDGAERAAREIIAVMENRSWATA